MPDARERLVMCFEAVFPDLAPDRIADASLETIAEWGSLASVRLIAVIEEEFEIVIPIEDYGDMASFQGIHSYLLAKSA
ncbi:MAG TPA: hypothetical protein VIQ74_17645 [Gemmatimonadaceae bacterium]